MEEDDSDVQEHPMGLHFQMCEGIVSGSGATCGGDEQVGVMMPRNSGANRQTFIPTLELPPAATDHDY